ncbi:HAD family hydrolase [Aeromicrobium sp. UC242_57]|uniref:HAD family hydrolase n=1 Tax=Aeromicrobium sp. UC242_57 TaxID=3374624 RepID=UPI003788C859
MSWRPRLIALDVDGTIVDGSNQMSAAVRESVRALRDSGIEIVISTGRAIPGVLDTTGKRLHRRLRGGQQRRDRLRLRPGRDLARRDVRCERRRAAGHGVRP